MAERFLPHRSISKERWPPDTKQAATCPSCGNTRDFDGVEPDDPAYRCCPDEFHSAHPVSAEPRELQELRAACEHGGFEDAEQTERVSKWVLARLAAAEARAAEAIEEAASELERRARSAADARDPYAAPGDSLDAVLLAREQENRAAAIYLRSLTPKHPQDEQSGV